MTPPRLPWVFPLVFSIGMIALAVLFFTVGGKLPDSWSSFFGHIVFGPFIPLLPVLRHIGLAVDIDAYSGPTPIGFLVGIGFYDVVWFGVAKGIQALRSQSSNKDSPTQR